MGEEQLVALHDWSYRGDLIHYNCTGCDGDHWVHRRNVTEDGALHHFCSCGCDANLRLIGYLLLPLLPQVAQGAA
jgi:hypothetical protein